MSFAATINKHLAALGTTLRAIRQSLRKAGIQGRLQDPWTCPIAKYLSKRTRKPITVGATQASRKPHKKLFTELPKLVQRFISNFDSHKYPELIEVK